MKQILAYSLMLFFIAALSAPVASFAAEDFESHKGQVPATTADLSDRPQEGAGVIAPGISCEACSKDGSVTHMTNDKRNAKKGSGSSDTNKAEGQEQQQ
jgi:hypothetical protein